ncbi:MAG TPA: MBL fold metallo-hydrolase [Solirubrobacteraceae bacterium]|nr:MBL fold metallo-hydrolase [Solirubrobacteraceae bacterium]
MRDGLATLPSAGDFLAAHFLNVGQGDCLLVVCGGWSVLFDGGGSPSAKVLGELEGQLPAADDEEPWLDLLCVSHYDADHIRGAAKVVDHLGGRVGHAFLPPILNPIRAMSDRARMLAERLAEHPLVEELRILDELADSLASRVQDTDIAPENLLTELQELLERDEIGLGDAAAQSNAPSPEAIDAARSDLERARLKNLAAIVEALRRMLGRGEAAGIDRELMWAALAGSSNAVVGATTNVGKQAIIASGVDELINALRRHNVTFTTPLAPDPASWYGKGCQICQLAPLPTRVEEHARRLPVAMMELLTFTEVGSLSYVDRVGPSNELSSVFALRTDRNWSSGILASADTPLTPVPMATRHVLSCCSLIKWSHHGGRSGEFPDRMIDAAARVKADRAHVFTTNRAHAPHHPCPDFAGWMRRIAAHPNIDLWTTFANAPDPSVLNCPLWVQHNGPVRVVFEHSPNGHEWRVRTPQTLTCACW